MTIPFALFPVSCGLCGTEGSGDGMCGSCLKRGFDEDAMDNVEIQRKEQQLAPENDQSRADMSAPNNVESPNDTFSKSVENTQPDAVPPMSPG